MVSQAKGGCSFKLENGERCGSSFHTKSYHAPRKELKRTRIKQKTYAEVKALPKPRKKRTTRAINKDKAWNAFSLYIRTRDCIRFTGDPERGMCVTCKTPKLRKELQAGHFVGGRGNSVLFREDIVYSQCSYCNQKPPMGLGGNYAMYTLWMMDEGHSRDYIEELLRLKGKTKVYKEHDFIEITEVYKEKFNKLLEKY